MGSVAESEKVANSRHSAAAFAYFVSFGALEHTNRTPFVRFLGVSKWTERESTESRPMDHTDDMGHGDDARLLQSSPGRLTMVSRHVRHCLVIL